MTDKPAKQKMTRLIRHYRLYGGALACGRFYSSRMESTTVDEGVTCKNCLKAMREWQKDATP